MRAAYRKRSGSRRRSAGVTLLELAMYLGIAGIVVATVAFSYGSTSSSDRVQQSVGLLNMIQASIHEIVPSGDYSTVTDALVANAVQVPKRYLVGTPPAATALKSPFNTNIRILSTASGGRFSVAMSGLPKDICLRLSTIEFGGSLAGVTVAASGTAVAAATPTGRARNLTEAQAECTSSTSSNSVVWEFY